MFDASPLQRAAEQPPCSSEAEAICLVGMFAVPKRMEHFDLSPHLWFPEHKTIWQAMIRAQAGDPDGFWLRTYQECGRLMDVLVWSPQAIVDNSDDGCLIFMLAYGKLERCTRARCELQEINQRAAALYRIPNTPYSIEERVRLLGHVEDIGWDIP